MTRKLRCRKCGKEFYSELDRNKIPYNKICKKCRKVNEKFRHMKGTRGYGLRLI